MKVSARMDYALRALLELGLHWPDSSPCQLNAVSKRAGVPKKFLIHILIALKNDGFVHSIRGKMGGYVLGKDPNLINLDEIVKRLEGSVSLEEQKRKKKNDAVSLLWRDIDKSILDHLKRITLEDLCNRQRQQIKVLSYDI